MIYPENFEEKTGFNKIRQKLKNYCLCNAGVEFVDDLRFLKSKSSIDNALILTREFIKIHTEEPNFPLEYFLDVRPSLEKIQVEGTYMDTEELFNFKRSFDTIRGIVNFFKKRYNEDGYYPGLTGLSKNVTVYPFVTETISSIITNKGYIRNNASKRLAEIRSQISEKESKISGLAHQILNNARQNNIVDSEASLTIREGKMLIPVPSGKKRQIQGYIYDESSTGKTIYIEPTQLFQMNNEIRELKFEEKREIIRILRDFADTIRPYLDELIESYNFLGNIDFIRAKALLANELKAIYPKIENTPLLDLRYAKHPLLYLHNKAQGKDVVPMSVELNHEQRILVISGPNAGGKSVCLQATGLLLYMAQCGLMIPANENSRIGIFSGVFIDIGDEQSIDNDLSTYSSHLQNMKYFVNNATENTLVLIDELGTGTEPVIGGAIAESILEELNTRNTIGVITTHYTNLKHYATSVEGMINGAMAFDNEKMEPLFQLEIGKPGSSFAFEIAKKIGLPRKIINKATKKTGQEHINFDKNLKKLEQERKKYTDLNKSLRLKEKELDKSINYHNTEAQKTLERRKNIIRLSHEEAKDILSSANKKIENTIAAIKKANAEKEETKKIRKQFETEKIAALKKQEEETQKIDEKLQKIKEQEKQINREKKQNSQENSEKSEEKTEEPQDNIIREGDLVTLKKHGTTGEIIKMEEDEAIVAIGEMHTTIKLNQLEKAKQQKSKKQTASTNYDYQVNAGTNKGDFVFGLDVRGKKPDEAIQRVHQYIDEAIMADAEEIKILHGTGTGVLRKTIRDALSAMSSVKTFRDENPESGGAGITVVVLNT